ncbi:MAG: CDP-glycerol glycerophosphotransferase family protein [Propionibacteriaceae bacterium]|jgi:hypothetical protein|nr:CDP-glycerol glycerophosphotransferase family protein [Propionibacteriaceae bacterium]
MSKADQRNADVTLRVNMPNNHELGLAVSPSRPLPQWLGWLERAVDDWYRQLVGATWALIAVCATLGWYVPAAVVTALSATVGWLAARADGRQARLVHRLGLTYTLQHTVRAALFAAALSWAGHVVVVGYLAVSLLLVAVELGFRFIASWLASRQPPLIYSPQGDQPATTVAFGRHYRWVARQPTATFVGELALLPLAVAGALTDVSPLVATLVEVGVGAGYLVWFGARLLNALRLGSEASFERLLAKVKVEIAQAGPVNIIHAAADARAPYVLDQWIGTFDKLPDPTLLMIRSGSYLSTVPKDVRLLTVYAPAAWQAEEAIPDSARVVYYMANSAKNVQVLREARLHHVFLNHGDSDKASSANPFVRVYNGVWVSGPAGIKRYEDAGVDLPQGSYEIVGRPQVESLKVGPLPADATPTVLYAPTFEGYSNDVNYSSLETMGVRMVEHILANHPGARIMFKPHPASGILRPGMTTARLRIMELLATGDHVYVGPEAGLSLYDCFDQANVLVSDISSVVSDFLYTERPIVVTNPRELSTDDFKQVFPTQASSYIAAADLSDFDALIADAIGPDSLRADRVAMKKQVLGDLPEGPTAAFIAAGRRAIAKAEAHAATIVNEFRLKE